MIASVLPGVPMPIKQENHKYIDKSIIPWLDLHFPADSDYQGRVHLGFRKWQGLYDIQCRNIDEVMLWVPQMHISPKIDYYITANTVAGTTRQNEDVFGLQNIVIDIDCHGEDADASPTELAEAFVLRCSRDYWNEREIPVPNSIVYTGRGVQLWYALEAISSKLSWIYLTIVEWLQQEYEGVIEENENELKGVVIDKAASKRLCGWFRLPCTYNTKTGTCGRLQILKDDSYTHQELYDMIPVGWILAHKMKSKKFRKAHDDISVIKQNPTYNYVPLADEDVEVISGGTSAMALRVHRLIQLRAHRNAPIGAEMRDLFCFVVFNALLADYNEEESWRRLLAFNRGFKEPLSEQELISSMSTSEEKKYSITNAWIIDNLNITVAEQIFTGIRAFSGEYEGKRSNYTRDLIRATKKADRNNKIIDLYINKTTKAEISRILGISRTTVTTVIKEYEAGLEAENEALEANIEETENTVSATRKKCSKVVPNIFVSYAEDLSPDPVVSSSKVVGLGNSPP